MARHVTRGDRAADHLYIELTTLREATRELRAELERAQAAARIRLQIMLDCWELRDGNQEPESLGAHLRLAGAIDETGARIEREGQP